MQTELKLATEKQFICYCDNKFAAYEWNKRSFVTGFDSDGDSKVTFSESDALPMTETEAKKWLADHDENWPRHKCETHRAGIKQL